MTVGRRRSLVRDTPGTASLLPFSEDERVTRDILLSTRPAAVVVVGRREEPGAGPGPRARSRRDGPAARRLPQHDGRGAGARFLDRRREARGPSVGRRGRDGRGAARRDRPARRRDRGCAAGGLPRRLSRSDRAGARDDRAPDAGGAILPAGAGARRAFGGPDTHALAARAPRRRRALAPGGGDAAAAPLLPRRHRRTSSRMPACARPRRSCARSGHAGSRLPRRSGRCSAGWTWPRPIPSWGVPVLLAALYLSYLFVGVFGAKTLVDVLENGFFGKIVSPAATRLADADRSLAARAGLLRRALRARHDGARVLARPRAADRRHVLHRVRDPRGLGLPAAPGRDGQPDLQVDGPERKGRPPDGPRTRVRHDGDAHDADPRDSQGAAHRDPAAGARRSVLGATDGHSRDARRALGARPGDLGLRGPFGPLPRRQARRARAAGPKQRLRPGAAAPARAPAGQPPRQDARPDRVVPAGSRSALRPRDGRSSSWPTGST